MKHLLIILILTGACIAQDYPQYTMDPNDIVMDANSVTYTITITVPKEQHRAMLYLNRTIFDMLKRSGFAGLWLKLIPEARAKITQNMDIDDLKAKVERE